MTVMTMQERLSVIGWTALVVLPISWYWYGTPDRGLVIAVATLIIAAFGLVALGQAIVASARRAYATAPGTGNVSLGWLLLAIGLLAVTAAFVAVLIGRGPITLDTLGLPRNIVMAGWRYALPFLVAISVVVLGRLRLSSSESPPQEGRHTTAAGMLGLE